MYVEIVGNSETKTYDDVRNISFAPQTDVIGESLPINEFAVDIYTDDSIRNGADIYLYDDEDNLWAKYWIVYAERMDEYFVRVRAQSKLVLLNRIKLPATMYDGDTASTVIAGIFNPLTVEGTDTQPVILDSSEYSVDSSLASETITGYCPEQTARERLLWVCFVIGAYVKTYFTDVIEIAPLDDTDVFVPLEQTYWKPAVSYADYVTDVSVTYFSFELDDPTSPSGSRDQIWYDGNYYNVTRTTISLANSHAPVTAPTNIVSISDVMIINEDNANDILLRMAQYYFDRVQVDLDAINNAEFMPGQKLTIYTDQESMVSGYAERCYFSFGLQAKSSIRLAGAAEVASGKLIILYKYGTKQIGKKKYLFPVGHQYSIENPYIDAQFNKHRYVFRPENQYATGTVTSGTNTNTQQCAVALDLEKKTEILYIVSVDDADAIVVEE